MSAIPKLRIKFLSSVCGHTPGGATFAYYPGSIVDWPKVEAERYIEKGIAVLADQQEGKAA